MGESVQPFRRHPRYLLLALLVFVAQITLAFYHTHAQWRDLSLSQVTGLAGETTPLPDDDDCRFCAAIHVASTLIPSAGPDLIIPKTTYSLAAPVCFVRPHTAARASPFRSRAPPQAMNV